MARDAQAGIVCEYRFKRFAASESHRRLKLTGMQRIANAHAPRDETKPNLRHLRISSALRIGQSATASDPSSFFGLTIRRSHGTGVEVIPADGDGGL